MKNTLEQAIIKRGYKIVTKIEPDSFGRYHGVVANEKGKQFFVKAVMSKNNYGFTALKSEIAVTTQVCAITTQNTIEMEGIRLRVPYVETVIEEGNILCMISNFAEGEKLNTLSPETQAKILAQTASMVSLLDNKNAFAKVTTCLKDYRKKALLIKTPYMFIKALILFPQVGPELIKTMRKVLPIASASTKDTLIHADINSSNIILDNTNIYLIDWEEAGWGIEKYNYIAPLSVHWQNKAIKNALLIKTPLNKGLTMPILAYRVLLLLNQKVSKNDPRHVRDMEILNFIASHKDVI